MHNVVSLSTALQQPAIGRHLNPAAGHRCFNFTNQASSGTAHMA